MFFVTVQTTAARDESILSELGWMGIREFIIIGDPTYRSVVYSPSEPVSPTMTLIVRDLITIKSISID